jgi:hypothetical protein
MGLGRAGLRRDTLGSLAIAGAVAVIAFALPIADHRVSGTKPVTAGTAYRVGAGVTLALPEDASVDVTQTRPGRNQGTAVFTAGAVRVAVVVTPYHNGLDDAAARLRAKIVRSGDAQLAGTEGPVTTVAGVPGRFGGYTGNGRAGTYAVFVADGYSAEVTASGSATDMTRLRPQLDQMVRSVSFGGGP